MIFHSFEYLLFLCMVVCLYFLLPHKYRWIFILGVSYYFYASWRVSFLPLLILSTLTDYGVGLWLEKETRSGRRKILLAISICVNIGLLLYFKYLAVGWNTLGSLLADKEMIHGFQPLTIILPLGISFYTFQTLGYTIDVYRGRVAAEKHPGIFAAYVTFFPQLLAGPIERAARLLPQFKAHVVFDFNRALAGSGMILLGLFKKLVIANRLYQFAEPVTAFPELHSPLNVLLAFPATIYEFYCDISGYTDIALGSALILGFHLSKNFDRPFAARSMTGFWQRYHITVTRWFRDYVLFRVAGRNAGKLRKYTAIFITMLLICLWHDPRWLVPGMLVGGLVIFETWWNGFRTRHPSLLEKYPVLFKLCRYAIGVSELFLYVFVISGITGYGSVDNCLSAVKRIFQPWGNDISVVKAAGGSYEFGILFVSISALEIWQWMEAGNFGWYKNISRSIEIRWAAYGALVMATITLGVLGRPDFLYFKF